MANNVSETESLLRDYPSTLDEQDVNGLTPIQWAAAVHSSDCMKLLLEHVSPAQINRGVEGESSALVYALQAGGARCKAAPTHNIKCSSCTCAEVVTSLLKADCRIGNDCIYGDSSRRCRAKIIIHLKNRRERLTKLALQHLPPCDLQRMQLTPGQLLDKHAATAIDLLQQRKVHVPDALLTDRKKSVFAMLTDHYWFASLEELNQLYRLGFRDVDALNERDIPPLAGLPPQSEFAQWLIDHGATPFLQLRPRAEPGACRPERSLTSAHCMARSLGREIARATRSEKPDLQRLRSALDSIFQKEVADDCVCKCSSHGCTPLTFLLEGIRYYHPSSTILLDCYTFYLCELGHRNNKEDQIAATRFLTFTTLDLPHTCCVKLQAWSLVKRPQEDRDADLEEDSGKVDLLESLMQTFSTRIENIMSEESYTVDELVSFYETEWHPTLEQKLQEMEGCDITKEERRGAEEIGVQWCDEPPSSPIEVIDQNPLDIDSLDYYLTALEQIE